MGLQPGDLFQGVGDVSHSLGLEGSSPTSQEGVCERLADVFIPLDDFSGVLVRHQQVSVGEEQTLLHQSTFLAHTVTGTHGVGSCSNTLDSNGVVRQLLGQRLVYDKDGTCGVTHHATIENVEGSA